MASVGTLEPKYNSLQDKAQRVQWKRQLQKFVRDRLVALETNKEIYFKLLESKPMNTWSAAFTHSSVDPNISANYETLEAFGDKVVGSVFVEILLQRMPTVTPRDITGYVTYFMSKTYQAKFANDLGLVNFVRSNVPLTPKIQGDVFEAFFGALANVGNHYYQGLGYVLCSKLMEQLLKDIDLSEVDVEEPKTAIKQILEKAQLPQVQIKSRKTGQGYTQLNIFLPQRTAEVLGHNASEPFVTTTASSKESAEKDAFSKALQILRSQGYNEKWAEEYKESNIMSSPELSGVYEQAKQKAKQQGYPTMSFQTFSTFDKTVAQLLGIREDGTTSILATASGNTILNAKTEALSTYTNQS